MVGHSPADDLSVVAVQRGRQVQPAFQGPDGSDVGHARLIGLRHRELPLEQVGSHWQPVVAVRRMPVAATLSAGDTGFLHQATRLITTDRMTSATEFLSHSPAPIATTFLIVDVLDLPVQALALLIAFTLTPGIEATAADVHDTAQHRQARKSTRLNSSH